MYKAKQVAQYGLLAPHQTALGNIDLDNRLINIVPNKWYEPPLGHPTIRTEESITTDEGLGFVNIPTIINGEKYSDKDAIMHYMLTNQHLGKFNGDGSMQPWTEADNAAEKVHLRQQSVYTK